MPLCWLVERLENLPRDLGVAMSGEPLQNHKTHLLQNFPFLNLRTPLIMDPHSQNFWFIVDVIFSQNDS